MKKRKKQSKNINKINFSSESEFSALKNTPFKDIKSVIKNFTKEQKKFPVESETIKEQKSLTQSHKKQETSKSTRLSEEEKIFINAMQGVEPIDTANEPYLDHDKIESLSKKTDHLFFVSEKDNSERSAFLELEKIVKGKKILPVSLTSEYVEGGGKDSDAFLIKQLHRGHYSVKDYCDLHGYDSSAAIDECNNFMENAISSGYSCVAFIHGRGLSSKGEPIIKKTVINWLKHGPFRHYVRAFSSAPAWDGGAGVTYVLLLQRKKRKHNN